MSSNGPVTPTMSSQRPRLAGEPFSQQSPVWQLDYLPDDVVRHVALLMPDPAALATSCRRTAAVLSQDTLLLDWARVHQPVSTLNTQHRHPGYVLLSWRRVHCLSLQRLTALLLRHCKSTARPSAADHSTAAASDDSIQSATELLDAGNALGAIQALLPHAEHLLLLYAAQAGHMLLLRELLAAHTDLIPARLQWDEDTFVDCNMLASAAHTAAKAGQVKALLAVLDALGSISSSDFLEQLLRSAATSGAAATVAALLQRCQASTGTSGLLSPLAHLCCRLLPDAAEAGSYPAVSLLAAHAPKGKPAWGGAGAYGQLVEQYRSAYTSALRHGHVHLLPLLKGSMNGTDTSIRVCEAATETVSGAATKKLLPYLPGAICAVSSQSQAVVRDCWDSAVSAALEADSTLVLDAIWQAASTLKIGKDVLCMTGQDTRVGSLPQLAKCIVAKLGQMDPLPGNDVIEWVLQHVLPSVDMLEAVDVVRSAALAALKHGHLQLVLRLVPAEAVVALVHSDEDWQLAERQAQLLDATARGDAPAVQAQLQQLGPAVLLEWLGSDSPSSDELQDAIKQRVAAIADEAAAEAVARVMAQHLNAAEGSLMELVVAHNGCLVPILCECSVTLRAKLAGPESDERYCNAAIAQGQLDTAEWLIRHEDQAPDYLSSAAIDAFGHVLVPQQPLQLQQWLQWQEQYQNSKDLVGHWCQLLHRLAAKQYSQQLDATAHNGGEGSMSLLGSQQHKQWPAGARAMAEPCLQLVVGMHNPDLLHALLVFRDAWQSFSNCMWQL